MTRFISTIMTIIMATSMVNIDVLTQYFQEDYIIPEETYCIIQIDMESALVYDIIDWYDNNRTSPCISFYEMLVILPPEELAEICSDYYVWSEENAEAKVISYLTEDIDLPDGVELDFDVEFCSEGVVRNDVDELKLELYDEEEA